MAPQVFDDGLLELQRIDLSQTAIDNLSTRPNHKRIGNSPKQILINRRHDLITGTMGQQIWSF